MDRCALFVDAGYLLADGAMAVHGTRHREAVSWDFGGLLQLLGNLARERTSLPMLRCYWYEATVEGRRAPEHEALADLPGLKLRLGRIRPGRREGVDTEIHRDLMALARNGALADAVVVSGDEDLAQVVADAQDLGVRVTVVHVAVDGNWTISRVLRQECDDLIEIGSGHLRPYVNLLTGVDGASGTGTSTTTPGPLSNGHGNGNGGVGTGTLSPLQSSTHSSPPPSSPITPAPASASGSTGLGSSFGSGTPSLGAGTPPPLSAGGLGAGGLGSAGLGSSVPGLGSSASGLGSPPSGISALEALGTSGIGLSGTSGSPTGTPSPLHAAPTPGPSATKSPSSTPPPSTGPHYSSSPMSPPSTPPPSMPSQPHGPYTGPQQIAPLPVPAQSAPSLSDAVKAAHQEGQDFGESVARDAPALWLEAVLARKPRMPSDLEARLLQGSSLPIDFLLHDEVRHALRRGFWDALERSRR
ncbi:NYN domain-containing protein [Actinomadura oligospora]|uniref:NYN domain-containing protein n=1 Tax=Actinomadura oligospora TaxID=111804 RepID=UPI00047B7AFA|nr:NYN domain-containing protein [Actinomadura oligospora]